MAPVVSVSESEDQLVLRSQTSLRSWAVFFGFVATGVGAAFYATDCCIWKLIYIGVGFAAGVWFLDDNEEIVFNKTANSIQISIQKFFCTSCCSRCESAKLDEVLSVRIDEQYSKMVITIDLANSATLSIGVTSTEIDRIECEQLVKLIQNFLHIDDLKQTPRATNSAPASSADVVTSAPQSEVSDAVAKLSLPTLVENIGTVAAPLPIASDSAASGITSATDSVAPSVASFTTTLPSVIQSDDASSVTSSEESFERINVADLADYEAVITETGTPSTESMECVADGTPNLPNPSAAAADEDVAAAVAAAAVVELLDEDLELEKDEKGKEEEGELIKELGDEGTYGDSTVLTSAAKDPSPK